MEKINKKIVLAVLFSCAAVLGAAWFVLFVQLPKIQDTSDAIQKEKLDSYVRQQKSDKIYMLKKDLSDIEGQKKAMEGVFIDKNDSVPFFRLMEKAAADAGSQMKVTPADISRIKFTTEKQASSSADDLSDTATPKQTSAAASNTEVQATEAAKADEISKLKAYPAFNIEVTGSYASDIIFLSKMENVPYFVRVLILDMVPVKVAGAGASLAGGAPSPGQPAENDAKVQNIAKMSLTVIVYSNDKK